MHVINIEMNVLEHYYKWFSWIARVRIYLFFVFCFLNTTVGIRTHDLSIKNICLNSLNISRESIVSRGLMMEYTFRVLDWFVEWKMKLNHGPSCFLHKIKLIYVCTNFSLSILSNSSKKCLLFPYIYSSHFHKNLSLSLSLKSSSTKDEKTKMAEPNYHTRSHVVSKDLVEPKFRTHPFPFFPSLSLTLGFPIFKPLP